MTMIDLPKIRRFEAVSFRSFPSTATHYDGTWAIRLTAGHPAKRLNSINPLDPDDRLDLESRIAIAHHRFESFGRPLVFRLTPLAPDLLQSLLVEKKWQAYEESVVMAVDLTKIDMKNVRDQLALQDIGRWVDAFIELSDAERSLKPGLSEIIGATQPATGLFLSADKNEVPACVVRCVHDRDLAGVFDLVTHKNSLRQGYALNTLYSALLWATRLGARTGWLQVVAENKPAITLYETIGFKEIYKYCYWRAPGSTIVDNITETPYRTST